MTDSYLGEIQAFPYSFVQINWLPCDGRLLQIPDNVALFSLIGFTYGGDGKKTFALPNLVSHVALSQGQGPGLPGYAIGQAVGQSSVTLSTGEMPSHTHGLQLGNAASGGTPGPTGNSNVAIVPANNNGFVPPPPNTALSTNAVTMNGGSQPHANAQPTLAMVYCICIKGIFPTFSSS